MSAEDDKKATEMVLKLLEDKSLEKVAFSMNKISVSPSMYAKVSQAIKEKKITVVVNPKLLHNNEGGRYYATLPLDKDTEFYDVLVLRSPVLGKGLIDQFYAAEAIVHECTHAGFDLLEVPKMTHLEH